MKYVYTSKAENSGVGKAGEAVPEDVTPGRLAYLQLHLYVVGADEQTAPIVEAVESPESHGGVFRRKPRVKP